MTRTAFKTAQFLVAFFIAIFAFLVALSAPAQQTDAAHSSETAVAQSKLPLPVLRPPSATSDATANRAPRTAVRPKANAPVNPLFLPTVTYPSGGYFSASVAVADFNRDGKLDLVVAIVNAVGVLLGNGDGTFQPVVVYNDGGYTANAVIVADLNGDGIPDLVEGSSGGGSNGEGAVFVFLGNGDGTFQTGVAYDSGGNEVRSVAVADLNGDGHPDIVLGNCASTGSTACLGRGAVGILLGNGDGTFRPVSIYDSGGTDAGSVTVADVNGDTLSDIVVLNPCTDATCTVSSVAILYGNGNGTFAPPVICCFLPAPDGVAVWGTVADVNMDGKPDIIVAGPNAGIDVLLGNGDGSFQSPVAYDAGGYPYISIAVGDVNGDGIVDLVGAKRIGFDNTTGLVNVLLGNGDGTFQSPLSFSSGGTDAWSVAIADLNSDGKPDVVVANISTCFGCQTGNVGVLINDSNSSRAPTTTTLGSSTNSSIYGQLVTFTAQVTSNSGTPTGTVILNNGSTAVGTGTLNSGKVRISVALLPAGSDSITAAYQGSATFAPSTSVPLTQTVTAATTTTNLASSPNPAATTQSVTFTATVTSQFGGTVTGSVTFSSGSQTLGTASLSGNTAILTTSFSSAGAYSISAKYNGDGNNSASTSSTLSQVIIASTTTTIVSSLNPSVVGQAVTFTATVSSSSGVPPNGETITFKNGSSILGTSPLSAGTASLTTSSLAAGIYTITASYPGDANFAASTSPGLRQVVNSTTKSATATTLISSLNPCIYGQFVTWTATVTTSGSVPPTGRVNFTWGIHTLASATLNSNGVATLTRSNLSADTYPLTAVYVGDVSNLGSTSNVVSQVITQATSSATLTSSPNPSSAGQLVTFTATITSPTVKPTGPVTFTAGKTVLGTAQITAGKANFTTSTLAVGSTKVTATYYGNSNVAASSASVTQTVQ